METLFRRDFDAPPEVSVILLDWSCRESFHSLHYLNRQTAPRDSYELIWIEYYDRRSPEIRKALDDAKAEGRPPVIDHWMVLDIPRDIYYHKHLCYNVGIVASRGRIVVLCDSDAVFRDSFIQTILTSFEEDPEIVLHMDQVRNNDRKFYPFNFPEISEITGPGAINFSRGTTTGLLDTEDILHTRNYGACFAALREDLISIGGADEHDDYVGHICGPYDMTFRLNNTGKREIWHPSEILYHTWHPGQAGGGNYLGPHDGRHMSTTALSVRRTGRIQPLLENPAIRSLRLGEDGDLYAPLLDQAIPVSDFSGWTVEVLERHAKESAEIRPRVRKGILHYFLHPISSLPLLWVFIVIFLRYFAMKITRFSRRTKRLREIFSKIFNAFSFIKDTSRYIKHIIEQVRGCLEEMEARGIKEAAAYGPGAGIDVLKALKGRYDVRIRFLVDFLPPGTRGDGDTLPVESAPFITGPIIVGGTMGSDEPLQRLLELGVPRERIVIL